MSFDQVFGQGRSSHQSLPPLAPPPDIDPDIDERAAVVHGLLMSLARGARTIGDVEVIAATRGLTIIVPADAAGLLDAGDHVQASQIIEVLYDEKHPVDPGRIIGSVHRDEDWLWIGQVVVAVRYASP